MYKKIWISLLVLLVSGCYQDDGTTKKIVIDPPADWQTAPKEYKCTVEQMDRVQKETQWCSDNTSYFKSYCYGSAFIRNCTKMGVSDGVR